ncbi:hypothetical protein [Tomitella biformata]|uniref:hypothetical protein n=1 Tax=Tomitella biformata TaxID=630403 RepID=UPI0004ADDDAB|nr:hypothetical protein [Tomitella biformata]
MSIPSIPGYFNRSSSDSLDSLWIRPPGNYPEALWPHDDLSAIQPNPTEWITVCEHFYSEKKHGGRGAVLVDSDRAAYAIAKTNWIGRYLGEVSVWDSGGFDDGISIVEDNISVRFLVEVQSPAGSSQPVVYICPSFLWYWDAYPTDSGWSYLNRAGRSQELVRSDVKSDAWSIGIRALELRQFLFSSNQSAIIQVDYVSSLNSEDFERYDQEFKNEWAHFNWFATPEHSIRERESLSGLMGQYVISPLDNHRRPRSQERSEERDYPDFCYGIDSKTGQKLKHTCDPDKLGTYFDKDQSRLHYLTTVHFTRDVLQRYASEPTKYRLSATRLECLSLWGLSLGINSAGLVEVYLGDIGRDLPSDEWGHWLSCNVAPSGAMDEGRFRRDFLNQWASSKDVMGDLRRARIRANHATQKFLNTPIWRDLTGGIESEFQSLIGPLSDDESSLNMPILTLTKSMVDSVNPRPLKKFLNGADPNEKSLSLLKRFGDNLGDKSDCTSILRALQGFRSAGGVAHLSGSGSTKAANNLGIVGMTTLEAFESIVIRITACLTLLADLMEKVAAVNSDGEP